MSFLKRAIRDGISKGIGDAVGKAVREVVEPRATEYANKAAEHFDQAAGNAAQEARKTTSGLEGAFANLERSMQGYATQMTKDLKVCPDCGQPTSGDKKFCPGCGAKLPEQTLGQSAVCPSCGKQNSVGTKFCQDCGTKLPIAVQEEQAARQKFEQSLARWDTLVPMYPRWNCGGTDLYFEEYDPAETNGYFATVNISFPRNTSGQEPLARYWDMVKAAGFRTAGRYPDQSHLYKMIGDKCYMISSEHAFEGGTDNLMLEFAIREPEGGFHYVKPEPKPQVTLKDLKSQLGGKEMEDLKDGLKDLKKRFRF